MKSYFHRLSGASLLQLPNVGGMEVVSKDLDNVDLRQDSFEDIVFQSCLLRAAVLDDCEFRNCSFLQCDLSSASARFARFVSCDLSGSVLANVRLSGASLVHCNMSGTVLSPSTSMHAFDSATSVENAFINEQTILPLDILDAKATFVDSTSGASLQTSMERFALYEAIQSLEQARGFVDRLRLHGASSLTLVRYLECKRSICEATSLLLMCADEIDG